MLGGHFLQGPSTEAKRLVVQQAGICKAKGDVGILKDAKPSAIKIYRPKIAQQDQQFTADPYGQGVHCAAMAIDELGGWRDPRLFIETWNEPTGQKGPDRVRLALFIKGFVACCHWSNILVCGFNFSTGNPEREDIEYFAAQDWCGVDTLGLHHYWGNAGFTVWNACRYELIYEWANHRVPPIIITEAGRDVTADGAGGQAGWIKCNIGEARFRAELNAYVQVLRIGRVKGIPLLGAMPFTHSPTSEWRNFDMEKFNTSYGNWEPEWSLVTAWQQRGAQPSNGGEQGTGGATLGADERLRYAEDIWRRAGVPFNAGSAIAKYWYNCLVNNRYLGKPEEPEHPSESGRYIVQAFAGRIVHYDTQTGKVAEGLPF